MSLVAAAALAAGGLGTAAALAGTTPWAEASGNAAASTHVASAVFAGHAGSSIPGAQLDALDVQGIGGAAASHITPAGQDWPPASEWVRGLAFTAMAPAVKAPVVKAPAAHAAPAAVQGAPSQAAAVVAARKAQAPAAGQPHAPKAAPVNAAPPKAAAAKLIPAKAAAAKPAPRKAAAAPHRAAPAPLLPYQIYDSVTPSAIPSGKHVATYANGAYAAPASAVQGRGPVLWIDTNGSDPRANVLDVEPGDATPAGAAQWVKARLSSQPDSLAIVYTMLSDWQAVKADVGALPSWMHAKVRYWIADPTGYNHVVPGSSATQWYWGNSYDITTANPNFQR